MVCEVFPVAPGLGCTSCWCRCLSPLPGGSCLGSPGWELLLSHLPGAFPAVTVHISPGSLPLSFPPPEIPRLCCQRTISSHSFAKYCLLLPGLAGLGTGRLWHGRVGATGQQKKGEEVQERCPWPAGSSGSGERDVEGQVTVGLPRNEGSDRAGGSDRARGQ